MKLYIVVLRDRILIEGVQACGREMQQSCDYGVFMDMSTTTNSKTVCIVLLIFTVLTESENIQVSIFSNRIQKYFFDRVPLKCLD